MKSEHNLYLTCEDSPQCTLFFWTFSCFRLALLASTVPWLLFLNATNCRLRSVLDSAKRVRCGGPTALSYPSSIVKKRRSSLSSITSGYARHSRTVSVHMTYEFRDVRVLWRVQIDIPKRNRHVRTYIAKIDPSFKPSRNALGNYELKNAVTIYQTHCNYYHCSTGQKSRLLLPGPVSVVLHRMSLVQLCCQNKKGLVYWKNIVWWTVVAESTTKVNKLFFNAVLPELACPRHHTGRNESCSSQNQCWTLLTSIDHSFFRLMQLIEG